MSAEIALIIIIAVGALLFFKRITGVKNKVQYKTVIKQPNVNNLVLNEQNTKFENKTISEEFLNFKLCAKNKLSDEQQQLIVNITQSFHHPHPLLLPLTQRAFEPNELFDLIKTDAQMTAKVLKEVNSSRFSLIQPITNINHAILFLGVAQVKSIAMQIAIQNDMEFVSQAQNQAYQKLWQASYMASAFGALFTKELNEENSAELSTRCLLSYLGDLALIAYQPSVADHYLNEQSLFVRTKILQEKYNINPAIIGQFIAKQWQLPHTIEVGIENSLLMLTNEKELEELSIDELRQTLLCYLSCRLGDLVAFNAVKSLAEFSEFSYQVIGQVEFYYLQNNIEQANVQQLNRLIVEPNFLSKINKIIAQLAD